MTYPKYVWANLKSSNEIDVTPRYEWHHESGAQGPIRVCSELLALQCYPKTDL